MSVDSRHVSVGQAGRQLGVSLRPDRAAWIDVLRLDGGRT